MMNFYQVAVLCLVVIVIPTSMNAWQSCPSSLHGRDGRDGRDGQPGLPGRDGRDGAAGVQGPPGPSGTDCGGVVYTRWGSSSCPNTTGTELVYSGRMGGSHHSESGGGANYLCLPEDPEYNIPAVNPGHITAFSSIHEVEYEFPPIGTHDTNAPCAVCHTTARATVLMVPAKASCPSSWTREYAGFIMSEASIDTRRRTVFECIDEDQESIPGTEGDGSRSVIYRTMVSCTEGLPCPPYNGSLPLNCVVCTK